MKWIASVAHLKSGIGSRRHITQQEGETMTARHPALLSSILACGLALGVAALATAQVARGRTDDLARRALAGDRLAVHDAAQPFDQAQSLLPGEVKDGWTAFRLGNEGEWRSYVDPATGRISSAEGAGVPWIPGRGNRLTAADVAPFLGGRPAVDTAALEAIARAFLGRVGKLLGVDPASLVLDRGRSGQAADYLWFVEFNVVADGRPVEGARVTFTVNNGNLIQFGTTLLPSPGAAAPPVEIEHDAALAVLSQHVGGFDKGDRFADPGSLHLLPVDVADPRRGPERGLIAVWEFAFRRDGVIGTWRGRVDATTGELLAFEDVNDYAQVTAGVYPQSAAAGPEVVRPLPFAGLSSGVFTDSAGFYDYLGGAVTTNLSGPYVSISDSCTFSTLGFSNGGGNIFFPPSPGTDCATPTGVNATTHAARMQFYHVNRIMEAGRGWLPANTWLSSRLQVNVNLTQACNAYWSPFFGLNLFQSGSGCANTGEVAGIALHEWGHGLDQNDGNGSALDGGTRESYGDVTAALVTHDSCSGRGFLLGGVQCSGYGDACTACSGARELDWAAHVSGTPHTVANFTQPLCPNAGFGGSGPCGREPHCESALPSEAVWDLAARDLPGAGSAAAWAVVDRLWYRSRATAGSAFTCNTGGATWTSDGCTIGSLWRVLRAADDDDGNLANGTPHSCALYAALNRHGIACPGDPAAATCFAACAPPAAPSVTLTPGHRQVRLDWTDLGAGIVYDVYRNETSCNGSFTRIAAGLVGTAYSDGAVADGLPYNYQVIARPSGNEACAGAPSACQSATPVAPACGLAAPATATATAVSPHQINLSWSAVPGATDYNVYRASSSGGPYLEVQSLRAPATTWSDTGLPSGGTFFYVVRAAADCESGNSPEATATAFPCSGTTLYSNDFESGSGLGDWTTGSFSNAPASEWRGIQSCAAHSGQHVFRFGGAGCTDPYNENQNAYAQVGGAAGVAVPTGVADARLSFWHRWDFESCCDGGYLSLSLDGGQFFFVPPSVFLANPPDEFFDVFTGTQASFVNSVVDLDAACNLAGAGGSGCAGHTLFLRFVAFSDSSFDGSGWFLDDVTITACKPHGCTGAPVAGAATTPANGQIQVSWANGAPPSASFNVYRAVGTCAAPITPFTPIGTLLAGSPFLDATASGTVTYAYRVTGLEGTGKCESDPSACIEATATGPCTAVPLFAGLATAAGVPADVCSVQLSWAAAIPLCGGPATYNVYRGTTSGFTPGAGNRIATGLSGTAFADPGPLVDHASYYYVVRAVDNGNGAEDGNLARKLAQPVGLTFPGTRNETFEGTASGGGFDFPGWSHTALSGPVDWTWTTVEAQSPTHSWFSPNTSSSSERVLVSPPFSVFAGTNLSFWHAYEFNQCFDGGTLEISTDDGVSWSTVPALAFTTGGYTGTIFTGPLFGKPAWCFGTLAPPTLVSVDLSAYAGATARVRWHAGDSGFFGNRIGWFVDSVTITNTRALSACLPSLPPAAQFYTLTPCRLVDTRSPDGPLGGPSLPAHGQRTFTLAGSCGVPATAKALSINVTVVQPASAGDLRLYPADQGAPLAAALNFRSGQTRTNNAVLGLSVTGVTGAITVQNDAGVPIALVLDVNGYFQ
jgi:trimeric autotransporter adhesin